MQLLLFFLVGLRQKVKNENLQKKTKDRHYHNCTEENMANAVAAVNNVMSKTQSTLTIQIPDSTPVI